jgi:LytS/YehU family sensor histidine kinase
MIVLDAVQSYKALQHIGVSTQLSSLFSMRNVRPDLLVVFFLMLIPSFIYYFIKKQLKAMESKGFQLYRKKEAELAQLKSQVNPHFLFNTLNTLYAFALKEGSEKTAESIAKLANLMRFMLDDMEKETILLKREISYIHDYVKLQSIRSAVEHDIAINVDVEDEESFSIAPMLLIPFVENAFKHGMNPNKVSQLKIDIHASNNQMQFVIENSIDENFQSYYKEKGFGIGIENVKSRLRYVYPNRHTLSIAKTNASFIVILNIED